MSSVPDPYALIFFNFPCSSATGALEHSYVTLYPSEFVVKIVKFAENVLNCELKKENWLKKFFFDFCNIKICNGFVSLYGNIFKSMDNHSYELMKIIVSCFLSIRFKSHARLINERIKKQNLRSKLMKIVLQNHQ